MNRSYNHIKKKKHLVDDNEVVSSKIHRPGAVYDRKHRANHLDEKQRHTGFDITNMICRNLVPPVESKVRSTEVVAALTSMNTLRILNTIKPVTRPFTAMVAAKLVIYSGFQASSIVGTTQVARGYKLKSAYQMKID